MSKARPFLRIVFFGIVFLALLTATRWFREQSRGEIIFETVSDYSHIRVRENDGVRSLLFVDDRGAEQLQSSIDLEDPASMQVDYTKVMFASLLFQAHQERILIVGLGGGGMVRFVEDRLPETVIEVVEIDPEVVSVAAEYFGTTDGPRTTIHTADAFEFLRNDNGPYDAIYMDAFLKPRAPPELGELTQRLKTVEFLGEIKSRLREGGVVAFNLVSWYPSTRSDIESIGEVFSTVYRFAVPGTGNLVIVATDRNELSKEELIERADKLQEDRNLGLPFETFVDHSSR